MELNFRNVLAFFYGSILILSGSVRQARKRAMRGDFILSIYFHKPSKKEFEGMIKWLMRKEFSFLSTSDLKMIIDGELPFPKGAVLITVDDGWQSNEENIVDIAKRYKIPVTIFVSTQAAEEGVFWWSFVKEARKKRMNYPSSEALKKVPNQNRLEIVEEIGKTVRLPREAMTIDRIREISKSKFITIGGHTHSHPILTNCNYEHILDELSLSKQKLESWIGEEVDSFAFPNGSYYDSHTEILTLLNYRLAFSNKPKYCTRESLTNRHLIPRFGFLENASLAENICRVTGVWYNHTRSIFKKY